MLADHHPVHTEFKWWMMMLVDESTKLKIFPFLKRQNGYDRAGLNTYYYRVEHTGSERSSIGDELTGTILSVARQIKLVRLTEIMLMSY